MDVKIRSTTILGVRKKGQIAIGGDGQVTFGDMAFKQKAIKVREFDSEKGVGKLNVFQIFLSNANRTNSVYI